MSSNTQIKMDVMEINNCSGKYIKILFMDDY